jgi:hypothetical protein
MKIFILASERSGSNLLRTLLGNHKDINAPIAPHLFREFYRLIDLYGDLSLSSNKQELLQDMFNLVNQEYHAWGLPQSVLSKAMGSAGINSLAKAIDFFYSEKAKIEGKSGYCSKGIHNFDYAHYIKNEFSEVKFIYLTRDPRDVTASWLKTPLHLHTPFRIAQQWNEQQFTCRRFRACYPQDVISLKYENLIADTVGEMTRVQKSLGLDLDAKCFSTNIDNQEAKNNEFWKNLNKPVIKGNTSKFLDSLSLEEINIIETISKENMISIGYMDFCTNADWTTGNSLLFKVKEKIRVYQSKRSRGEATKNVMERVHGKVSMMKNVRRRLLNRNSGCNFDLSTSFRRIC